MAAGEAAKAKAQRGHHTTRRGSPATALCAGMSGMSQRRQIERHIDAYTAAVAARVPNCLMSAVMEGRRLKLKATFESRPSYFRSKR